MPITIKRPDKSDIPSLAPVILGLALWIWLKGLRYVPP